MDFGNFDVLKFVVSFLISLVCEGGILFIFSFLQFEHPFRWLFGINIMVAPPITVLYILSINKETINFWTFSGIFAIVVITLITCRFAWNKKNPSKGFFR